VPQKSDDLATILTDLLDGPQPGELLKGLTTAIPSSTALVGVTPNPAGTPAVVPNVPVTINLSEEFLEVGGAEQVAAIEQMVFTVACDLAASVRVLFEVGGSLQAVPILGGGLFTGAVTASDYLATGTTLSCTNGPAG
jgi:spore germination protein GerM